MGRNLKFVIYKIKWFKIRMEGVEWELVLKLFLIKLIKVSCLMYLLCG